MIKALTITNLLTLTALAFPSSVVSKEISYDFVQGTYSSISDSSIPGVNVDADGLAVSGAFSVSPNVAITAEYGTISYDRVLGADVDFTELKFGFTAHTSITPETDVFGNFSVLKVDADIDNGTTTTSNDDTGNAITIGLRHLINYEVELDVSFSREDIYDDTDNTFAFGARFYANERFSIGVGYETSNEDVDAILLNARIDVK